MRTPTMRYRLRLVGSIPLFAALLLLALVPVGCGTPDKAKPTDTGKKAQEDPWLKAVTAIRQETDATTCRRVLNELNQAFASTPVDRQPKLGEADAAFAKNALNLDDAEMKEIRSTGHTTLDPNHLAEALYLRDIARSLDVANLPVAERARTAFEWVCRQVLLNPWMSSIGQNTLKPNPPLPPTYVLRRGWGSGLERMLIVAALGRQMGFDVCLIGPAAAADRPMLYQPPGRETEFPRGPFWGLGVRDGDDILLFDPWKEQALPGKNGRPATLADVRANPRDMAVWLDNPPFAWSVTADDLKAGEIFLTAPLSAVAARNTILEEKLAADIGVKLSTNLAEVQKRVEGAAKGIPVRYYSPAKESFAPTRALRSFLSVAEGGTAAESPTAPGLQTAYFFDQLPRGQLLTIPAEMIQGYTEPKERLLQKSVSIFEGAFLSPPTPREKIQRGQYVDATQKLVGLRDFFGKAEAQQRGSDAASAAAIREWAGQLNALYDRFNTAGPGERTALRTQIDDLWKPSNATFMNIVGAAVAQPGLAESTYLLALAKHEQAERAWAKAQRLLAAAEGDPAKKPAAAKAAASARTTAIGAWAEAGDWWSRYEPYAAFQSPNYPGRAALAKRLTDRANQLGAPK